MFVVARKVFDGGNKSWRYWTGSEWVADRSKALGHPDRATAIATHAALLKAQDWPAGGNPLVVERK